MYSNEDGFRTFECLMKKRRMFYSFELRILKKDSIFAVPNIMYSTKSVSNSAIGIIIVPIAVGDMRFRTPVGGINVSPACVLYVSVRNGKGGTAFFFLPI